MDVPLHCYRHPNRETYVSCSECGRGICPDCMAFAPVGIRCPEHASVGTPKQSAARTMRQVRGTVSSTGAPITTVLIAINVLVYLITVGQGGGVSAPGGKLFENGALYGPLVADGDWWRLFTAMFLHASLLHIAFNMFALWLFGSVVERSVGPLRYVLVYVASGLAGSAGALIATPNAVTVGASGAIFGLLGALLVLEYLQTGSFAGQAMGLIVINLALSFAIPNISIGGHIGGLIGGVIGMFGLALTRYRRPRHLGPAIVVAVAVASVVVAVARVRNYI
jgi:membrane associated rhomboid family serine protease